MTLLLANDSPRSADTVALLSELKKFLMVLSTTLCILLAATACNIFCNAFQPISLRNRSRVTICKSSSRSVVDSTIVNQRAFAQDKRPIILFDGVCNLCNNAVNLALDWDPKGRLRFSALQSNVGRSLLQANGREAGDISSIVVVTEQGAYTKSDAILVISEELTPLPLLSLKPVAMLGRILVPRFLRDLIYDGVADNRYKLMGKRNECRFDADGEFEDRFLDDSIAF